MNSIPDKGTIVEHKEYGKGIIIGNDAVNDLYVDFFGITRIFPYPESFDKGYLHTSDYEDIIEFKDTDKFILIKTSEEAKNNASKDYPNANNEELTYHAVRASWHLSLKTAQKYKYVIGTINGIVIGCYKNCRWYQESESRIAFEGEKADDDFCNRYMNKRIPSKYRTKGAANPCRYVLEVSS